MGLKVVLADDGFDGLWAEHLPAWNAWCRVSRQWRVISGGGAMGGGVVWLGLDYGAVHAGLGLAGIVISPEEWAQVQQIEVGAAEELNRVR